MISRFLKQKKKRKEKVNHDNKDIKNMFQQKYINSTWYEHLEIKLEEYLHMHHQSKRNRRKRVKMRPPRTDLIFFLREYFRVKRNFFNYL